MGKTNKKICFLITVAVVSFVALLTMAQEEAGQINGFKLPQYNKDSGKLDFILYGEKATKLGIAVKMEGVVLDIIQDYVNDPSKIKDSSKLKLYKINSKRDDVEKFWKNQSQSKLLIETPKAIYNEATKIIKGDEKIHLRAPSIDIDGIGFDADQSSQIVIVRKDVKVVLRSDLKTETEKSKAETEKSKKSNNENTENKVDKKEK